MSSRADQVPITIICWKCDHKFTITVGELAQEVPVFLGEDDQKVPARWVRPKTYSVPCPRCGAENELTLP